MTRIHLGWLLLSGCNVVFPLRDKTPPADSGGTVDQSIENTVCPVAGTTPRFGSDLFTRATNCLEYTEDLDGGGLASCGTFLAESANDDPSFAMIPNFESTPEVQYQHPRLSPEGGQLFMVVRDDATGGQTLQTATKSGSSWSAPMLIGAPTDPDLLSLVIGVGTPTMGPVRHMMINVADGIHEVELDGLELTNVRIYGADLGVTFAQTPNLTSDGLHAVAQGVPIGSSDLQVFYLERPSVDVPFQTATVIEGAPISSDAFMTSNCARLYASSVSKVLYARQL